MHRYLFVVFVVVVLVMGLFPPDMGKWLAPQGPAGSAPGALLLVSIVYYGGGD